MIRYLSAALAAAGLFAVGAGPASAQGGNGGWGTIKGRIVWGGAQLPKPEKVNVSQDKDHCLAKGALFNNRFEVDSKTRGLKSVVVALKAPKGKKIPIHPDLKDVKQKEVYIDQPRCLFIPRVVAMREGQIFVAKNSAPVNHNIKWDVDEDFNKPGNVTLPPGKQHQIKGLKAQPLPVLLSCGIHPWMGGQLWVFDHPYFVITGADGSFEIRNVPAGTHRLTIYHEAIGWRGGAKGKAGIEVTVKAGEVTDLGNLSMGK